VLLDQVFISYRHEDTKWREELEKHLKPYVRAGSIKGWSDIQIVSGSTWFGEIKSALVQTNVAVLLVTPAFLASDFIHEHELGPLLKEAEEGGVTILWVAIYASAYKQTALEKYHAVLDPKKPLGSFTRAKRDEAWVKICEEIGKALRATKPFHEGFLRDASPAIVAPPVDHKPVAPIGNEPIELRFHQIFEPDMNLLATTIDQYARWSKRPLYDRVSVKVSLSPEFLSRLATLQNYFETDKWPCEVEQETKDQVRHLVETFMPECRNDMVRAIRVAAKASVLADGRVLDRARNAVLEAYLAAKAFAALRALRDMWLINEPNPPWRQELEHLDYWWSGYLISGLTYIVQRRYNWVFWTDVDWSVEGNRLRVYVPQTTGRGTQDLKHLTQEDCWWHMLPQLLTGERFQGDLCYTLGRYFEAEPQAYWDKLTFRNECFIDTETHNHPGCGDRTNKKRVEKMVAERIVEQLQKLDPSERRLAYFDLAPTWVRFDNIYETICQLMPELREPEDLAG